MRTGITLTGVLVLVIGLIVAGGAAYYTNTAGEWAGGILAVLGVIVGVAGAAMAAPPKTPPK